MNLVEDNVKVIQGIYFLLLLLMVASMARLTINQKLYILAGPTVILLVHAVMFVVNQYIDGYSFMLGFTPLCWKYTDPDVTGILTFITY